MFDVLETFALIGFFVVLTQNIVAGPLPKHALQRFIPGSVYTQWVSLLIPFRCHAIVLQVGAIGPSTLFNSNINYLKKCD